jgi:hypothetical protein
VEAPTICLRTSYKWDSARELTREQGPSPVAVGTVQIIPLHPPWQASSKACALQHLTQPRQDWATVPRWCGEALSVLSSCPALSLGSIPSASTFWNHLPNKLLAHTPSFPLHLWRAKLKQEGCTRGDF